MKKLGIYILFFGFVGLNHLSFAAEKVYVSYFEVMGMPGSNGYSLTNLFNSYLKSNAAFELVEGRYTDTISRAETPLEARESAELFETKFYVSGNVIKLDDMFVINVSMYTTSTGVLVWNDSRKCLGMDDMDIALKYLAMNLGNRETTSISGDLNTWNKGESAKVERLQSNMSFGVSSGGMYGMVNNDAMEVLAGLGLVGSFDVRDYIFQLNVEFFAGAYSEFYDIQISTLYPFTDRNNTPFVMAGIGYNYLETGNDEGLEDHIGDATSTTSPTEFYNGLMFSGGGGYLLKRNSNVHIQVYAKGYVSSYPIRRTIPFGAILGVGLLFGS